MKCFSIKVIDIGSAEIASILHKEMLLGKRDLPQLEAKPYNPYKAIIQPVSNSLIFKLSLWF